MDEPVLVADTRCSVGEGPLWHAERQCLFWTDMDGRRLHGFHPERGQEESWPMPAEVGSFTIQADGSLLLFMKGGAIASWEDGILTDRLHGIAGEESAFFNDVIADPEGRVFAGTIFPAATALTGGLWRLDPDGSLRRIERGIGTANGLGFSPDHRFLYFTDSASRTIHRYDYEPATGRLSNRIPWLITPQGEGEPDGLTVDADGCIWSARWDGGAIHRYAPDAREILVVPLPARKVTSLTFGGADLGDLYITTSLWTGTRASEGAGAGALFRLRCGARGLPEFRSRLGRSCVQICATSPIREDLP